MNLKMKTKSVYIYASIICLLVLSGTANTQEFRGSISGVIADSSGAAVPGAQVIITNTATNTSTTTTTNEEGSQTPPAKPVA